VLVRVHASALNRADLLQREGRYPAPPGAPRDILGMEVAGEVETCGHGVTRWREGDRVFGIVGGGGNAEYVTTREAELARIPDTLTWEQAAAVPEAFITAHDALVTQAGFVAGERVLIDAIGSGVGLAAVQLVRALKGTSFGTARTADKVDRAREYGLTDGMVVANDPAVIVEPVRRWSDGNGVNVALELVGGAWLPSTIECVAMKGRIVLIGLVAGRSATLNLGTLLSKRLVLRGTTMRARPAAEKASATEAFARDVIPFIERGVVRPVIDRVLPLDEIRAAHEALESNTTFGKVVLRT
jgi:NADPH2:quinone reductase